MSKTSTIGSAKSSMKRKNSIWHALPYIAPHFIIFAVFGIIPIIFGIGLAFTRWNMVGAPKFVGLQNFAKIFDPSTYFYSIFWRDLGHTLLFVLVSVPLTIIVPLLLAVALSKKGLKGAGLFQAIFYIPGLISIAAGALVWRMVSGTHNKHIFKIVDKCCFKKIFVGTISHQTRKHNHPSCHQTSSSQIQYTILNTSFIQIKNQRGYGTY